MDKIILDSQRYVKKGKVFTAEQALADEIYSYFGKKLPFARIMYLIKTKGRQAVYEIWNEVRKSSANDHLSLFLWRVKNEKIVYKKLSTE
jgi:hypothetical protein